MHNKMLHGEVHLSHLSLNPNPKCGCDVWIPQLKTTATLLYLLTTTHFTRHSLLFVVQGVDVVVKWWLL